MLYRRRPVVTMRTKLETSQILERVARLIPERKGAFRHELIGGGVEAEHFWLIWYEGEGGSTKQ